MRALRLPRHPSLDAQSTRERPASLILPGLQALAVGVVYFGGAKLGLHLAFANRNVTAVWPPTGIAVAGLLLFGPRVWPGIAAGALLANVSNGLSVPTAAGIAVGNTLAPVLADRLLRDVVHFRDGLDRLADVLGLVFGAGVLCMTVSATLGTSTLALAGQLGHNSFGSVWLVWWVGDALGVVLFAPFLLTVAAQFRPPREGEVPWLRRRPLETGALVVTSAIATHVLFSGRVTHAYPLFLFVVWAALRLQQPGAALVTVVASSIATWHTVAGRGPFTELSLTGNLLALQAFNGAIALSSLVLAAVMDERQRAHREVKVAAAELEERVRVRTAELAAAEREAHEHEERLQEAQGLAHIGSWYFDVSTNVVTWSEELFRIYGYEPQAFPVTYERFLELVHSDDRAIADAAIRRAFETGEPFTFEHRVVRPSGEIRTLEARGRVVRDADGKVTAMVGTGRDVTEQKGAEEQLRDANRLKDEFLSIVSHELRSPLASVLGLVDLLRTDWKTYDEAMRDEMLRRAGANAEEMSGLINRLLDYSRLQSGRVTLEPRPLLLSDEIRLVVGKLQHATVGHPVELFVPPDLKAIADNEAFERVLGNLVSNASKYSAEGTPVEISASRNGSMVEIAVHDHGAGIPPDDFDKIFDRFFRGRPDARRPGTGLGLAIARRYVGLMGGTISVASEQGVGSVFSFTLPAA